MPRSSSPPLKHLKTTNVRICTDLPASRAEMNGFVSTAITPPGALHLCRRYAAGWRAGRRPPVGRRAGTRRGARGARPRAAGGRAGDQGPGLRPGRSGHRQDEAVAHRIGYAVAASVVRPDRMLAVTFTTR